MFPAELFITKICLPRSCDLFSKKLNLSTEKIRKIFKQSYKFLINIEWKKVSTGHYYGHYSSEFSIAEK